MKQHFFFEISHQKNMCFLTSFQQQEKKKFSFSHKPNTTSRTSILKNYTKKTNFIVRSLGASDRKKSSLGFFSLEYYSLQTLQCKKRSMYQIRIVRSLEIELEFANL